MPGQMDGGKIKGTITYSGSAAAMDSLVIAAFKDGKPGVPAGFVISPKQPMFPYTYEITINAPAPAGMPLMYGITAYLDVDSNNMMGPGAEDKSAPPSMLVAVDECQGATVDLTIAP